MNKAFHLFLKKARYMPKELDDEPDADVHDYVCDYDDDANACDDVAE